MSDPADRKDGRDGRPLIRAALRTAGERPEPDVRGLVEAVPRMMAEARRRRIRAEATPLAAVVPLAAKAIPRLAAAAAVLVLLATALVFTDAGRRSTERPDLDSVLLGGADAGGVDDLLLGRTVVQGDEHG